MYVVSLSLFLNENKINCEPNVIMVGSFSPPNSSFSYLDKHLSVIKSEQSNFL